MSRIAWVVLVSWLAPAAALACSAPACNFRIAPASGVAMPANAPGPIIEFGNFFASPNGFEPSVIRLVTSAGEPVPFTTDSEAAGPRSFLVQADWVAGQGYRLQFPEPCAPPEPSADAGVRGEDSDPKPVPSSSSGVDFSFVAGSVADWPQTVGTVTASVAAEPVETATACGSCSTPVAAAVARLTIEPSPALQPFLGVTRYRVTVDGEEWTTSRVGPVPSGGSTFLGPHSRAYDVVFASCDRENPVVMDHGVLPGVHSVSVSAEIVGADVQPLPVTFSVNLDCAAWGDRVPSATCGGGLDWDGGSSDGGVDPPTRGEGCAGWFGPATLLAFAAIGARRRRPSAVR